jgi:hypothetical protein
MSPLVKMGTPRKNKATPAQSALVPESEVAAAMDAIAQANFLFATALSGADVAKACSLIAALNPDAVPLAAEALYRLADADRAIGRGLHLFIAPDNHPRLNS